MKKCPTCDGEGFLKTGAEPKPYKICYKCQGEPIEDVE